VGGKGRKGPLLPYKGRKYVVGRKKKKEGGNSLIRKIKEGGGGEGERGKEKELRGKGSTWRVIPLSRGKKKSEGRKGGGEKKVRNSRSFT